MNSSFTTRVNNVSRIGPLTPRCCYAGYGRDRFVLSNSINSKFSLPTGSYPGYRVPVGESKRRVPFRAFLKFSNSGRPSVSLGFSNRCRSHSRECARRLFNGRCIFGTNAVTAITSGATCNCMVGCLSRHKLRDDAPHTRVSHLAMNYANVGHAANRRPNNVIIIPSGCAIRSFAPVRCPSGSRGGKACAARFSFGGSLRSALLGLSRLNRSGPALCGCLRSSAKVPIVGISLSSPLLCRLVASARPVNISPSSVSYPANALTVPRVNAPFIVNVLARTGPGAFTSLLRVSNLSRNASI